MNLRHSLLLAGFAAATAGLVPAAAPAATSTAMPACAAGDPVVWENSRSKVFHLQGDSYYGKTKSGSYACQSTAVAAGYHAIGTKSTKSGISAGSAAVPGTMATAGAMAAPGAMASPGMMKHHRRHHGMASPSPVTSPGAMPAPGAMTSPAPAAT